MPALLIPIVTWIAEKLLGYLVSFAESEVSQHEAAVAQDDADKAALAKLAAAQTTADRINAAKDALSGL